MRRSVVFGAGLFAAAGIAVAAGAATGQLGNAAPPPTPEQAVVQVPVSFRVLDRSEGVPTISDVGDRGALQFAPNVTYAEAIREIFISQLTGRRFAKSAKYVSSLPQGKVLLQTAGPGEGITISLAAPYGWHPQTGQVNLPTIAQSGSLSAEQVDQAWRGATPGRPWPKGGWLDVPILPSCQVMTTRSDLGSECTQDDWIVVDSRQLRSEVLP